eukprot:gene22058-30292_t
MVSISDEYCEACKQTVNRYFYLSDSYGQERQKKRMGHNTGEDAKVVIGSVCIDEKIKSVLNPNKNTQKAELFTAIRQFCTEKTNACSDADFSVANVTKSARTQCNACHIISSDIALSNSLLDPRTKLRDFLEEGYCNNLGFSYQPYSWLESTCDEMVEENLDEILAIVKSHSDLSSVPSAVCKKLYRCKSVEKDL